ncbi:hypothetical protein PQB77_gp33 [Arthrobacter phage Correa]|uniref:Uncharacterized protein n=2 Tax=Mudcatvirus TaxID=1982088 RepID=A0A222ZJM6_9CAUD|nr:hypothetical protein PQB76_gp035 [Arthrobacter phage Cheesy]YP_010666321.1 hypothetical protein PQB77_gp33 [Arthrobacter phage Correa]ASR80094.1 hypothetical protein SEA_CORREA_33 [Arthrobacter phage Correa]ASR84615.1 hypothetical protein SEA_CHEESY_35 [Arthrobacter phage Cheesy]
MIIKEFKKFVREERPIGYRYLQLTKALAIKSAKVIPLMAIASIKKPSEKTMNKLDNFIKEGEAIIAEMDAMESSRLAEKEAYQIRIAELKAARRAKKGK